VAQRRFNAGSTVVQHWLKTLQNAYANAFVGSPFPFHPNLFQRVGFRFASPESKARPKAKAIAFGSVELGEKIRVRRFISLIREKPP
jgi:hypothetical protein